MVREYRNKFKTCTHQWELHADVQDSIWKTAWNGIFYCEKCQTFVTMIEKCSLDEVSEQRKSLTIQEKHTWNGMLANIISWIVLILSFFTLLFGDKILSYFK